MEVRSDMANLDRIQVRSFQPSDQQAVSRLFTEGLLAGQISDNDTGADIDHVHDAYFGSEANHFWVAARDQEVLGMIAVFQDEEQGHTAEIRRLRVAPEYQDTSIGARLLETALNHCKAHGFLKVVLDTRFDTDAVMDLFDRFGFQHNRTKNLHGKDLLEFYLDLYRQPKPDDQNGETRTPGS